MKSRILIFSLLVMFTAKSFATIKVWDGGGSDAYLSTQENWSDDIAPVSGDYLVFSGSTRTSVTNDYDPETTSFKMIVFSNNYTTCSSPFTLSGNEIVLTGCDSEYPEFASRSPAISVINASASLTETLELDVSLPNNSKLGTFSASNHHLTFKGTVTGNGGYLQSCDQYRSTLIFEGPVKNFSRTNRPNGGGGVIWLRNALNEFTSATFTHGISEGTLKVDSLAAFGGQNAGISLGQSRYSTPGTLSVNADQDTRIDGNLTVNGPLYNSTAGTFENLVADTVLTLGGNLNTVTHPTTGLGTMVRFNGAGNGSFQGNMTTASTWLNKSGTGTWELAGSSTTVATGDVSIAQGTLIVNGDYSSVKTATVKSGATLGGTGTVNNVTFENGADFQIIADEDGTTPLIVTGNADVSGSVGVSISAEALANLTAGVEYTIISFTTRSGSGIFMPGDGFPSSALLTEKPDSLVMQLATGEVTWKGDVANNVWDTTTLNWIGNVQYSDGSNASFTDAADAGTTNITIPSAISPLKMIVTGSRDYTFSGEGIEGSGMIEKPSGSSALTLNNTNSYTGMTLIEEGALVLNGTIADSLVWIDSAATFTNTAGGRLTGSASLVVNNGTANLSGNNDFTGGTIIEVAGSATPEGAPVKVNDPRALGSGDVSILAGTVTFQTSDGSIGQDSTLTIGENSSVKLNVYGVDITWLGDVDILNRSVEIRPYSGSSLTFGESGCTTEVQTTPGGAIFLREGGDIHWYSRLRLGNGEYSQTDGADSHFYATSNEWSSLIVKAWGGAVCHATNTLASTKVSLGQIYFESLFHPWLDLNGYDQTIAELEMVEVIEGSTQTVKSDTPAILTILNDSDTVTERQGSRIQGQVTLRKLGTGNWSFGSSNQSAGDFIVEGGTVTLTESDTLPTASDESRLTVFAGAKVAVSDGINVPVPKFTYNDVKYAAGVYGGVGCAVPGARIMPECFEPGTGAITVTRGDGGLLIMIK